MGWGVRRASLGGSQATDARCCLPRPQQTPCRAPPPPPWHQHPLPPPPSRDGPTPFMVVSGAWTVALSWRFSLRPQPCPAYHSASLDLLPPCASRGMVRREPCTGPQCHMASKGESGGSCQGRTSSVVSTVRLGPELRPLPTG